MKGLILACLIGFNTYPPVQIQEAEQNYINVNEISEIKTHENGITEIITVHGDTYIWQTAGSDAEKCSEVAK